MSRPNTRRQGCLLMSGQPQGEVMSNWAHGSSVFVTKATTGLSHLETAGLERDPSPTPAPELAGHIPRVPGPGRLDSTALSLPAMGGPARSSSKDQIAPRD